MRTRWAVAAVPLIVARCALVTDLAPLRGGPDATDDSPDATDADATNVEAAPPCDSIEGGVACTPGEVDCPSHGECTGKEICCTTYGCIDAGLLPQCLQLDGGSYFFCDESADCEGGQCCYGHSSTSGRFGSRCNTECDIDPEDVTACKQDSDCASTLEHCMIVTCEGHTVETCGGKCPS